MFLVRIFPILSLLLVKPHVLAFTTLSQTSRRHLPFVDRSNTAVAISSRLRVRRTPWDNKSSLSVIPLSVASVLPIVKKTTILAAVAWLTVNFRRIFSPNSVLERDLSVAAPLPPAAPSCPFIGNNILGGSTGFGAGYFYSKTSKILGQPRIWLYSFLGKPGIVISGGKRIKDLLNLEFKEDGVSNFELPSGILNADSILAEKEKATHSSLRRLVGAAMTPAMVSASMPNLQASAEKRINEVLEEDGEVVCVEDMCTAYTLDVAWKQILGLDLKEDDIPFFKDAVNQWISGFTSPRLILNIFPHTSPSMKAKQYLVQRIVERIERLERDGPDSSTLSGMVFARDSSYGEGKSDGLSRKLTRSQVVENSLVLILAGTETSASTLTNAMLFLGLSPDIWRKVVEEQRQLKERHGSPAGERLVLRREMLDTECPYLDGVIKETMRIKPITSGGPRMTRKTLMVDGYQIPKGWGVNWNVLLTHELDPITRLEDGSHMDVRAGFVPERWLDEATRPTSDFIPMGAGPRYCLGATLAYAEMKVFLAVLAQNVDYRLADEGALKGEDAVLWKRMSIIPKPADGVPIVMTPVTAGTEGFNISGLFGDPMKQTTNNISTKTSSNFVEPLLNQTAVESVLI